MYLKNVCRSAHELSLFWCIKSFIVSIQLSLHVDQLNGEF